MDREKEYHKSRCMFAFIGGHLRYVTNDPCDHKTWLKEEFHIGGKKFENIDRGNMTVMPTGNVKCIVYKGSDFRVTDVTPQMIKELKVLRNMLYAGSTIYLYTGVHIGKIGDIWPPIKHICTIYGDE